VKHVRYPTAQGGGLYAPLAVRARLDLTRLSQEEATSHRATLTGSVQVRTLGQHLSPKLCKPGVQQADRRSSQCALAQYRP
jgi:hypothetical protein